MPHIAQVRLLNYNGEDIGMGFNSDTGLAVGTAVEFEPPTPAVAQEAQSDVKIITTHEQLMEKLNMSFSLEGRYAFVSGSAKVDYSKNTEYNSSSTFVVAAMSIRNTVKRGRNFRTKPDIAGLLGTMSDDDFERTFGDSFVRAHFEGGEFYAVMRITSVSSKVQTQLAMQLQLAAQGLIASAEFKASMSQANSNEQSRSEFSVKYYQKGGAGAEEIGTTLEVDEIKERLRKLPEAIVQHPFPYLIEVATYDTIPLQRPPKEQREAFLAALQDAENKKLRYIQMQNDCFFAAEKPEYFFEPPARAALQSAASVYLSLANAAISHAVKLSRGEIDPPQFFNPGALTPPLTEPDLVLRKRDVGLELSFADFWVTKDHPATRKSERDLVTDIGLAAQEQINDFNAIVDPGGSAQATLRLQGEALARIVATFRAYDWERGGMRMADAGPITSLSKLPAILPATVRSLRFPQNAIDSAAGLDQFPTLAELDLSHNRIETIDELGAIPALRELALVDNLITSLQPLSKCPALETLDISGNAIGDLTPLGNCPALKNLTLWGTMLVTGEGTRPSGNPITDARALGKIAGLANPFTLGKTLSIRVGVLKDGPAAQFNGTATRIANSHMFRVLLQRGAETRDETWALQSIAAIRPNDSNSDMLRQMTPDSDIGDFPLEGSWVWVREPSDPPSFALIGLCHVDPAQPQNAVIDLQTYPLFGTKVPFPTLDAVVIN